MAVTLDLSENVGLLLPQYDGSARLRALVTGLLEILDGEIVAPLLRADRGLNPDESEGFLLDLIGVRIGITRPYVQASGVTYLGFDGTESAGGRPFGLAPLFTRRAAIEQVVPVGDVAFRAMLKGRALFLRSTATREDIEAIANRMFGANTSYLDESVDPIEVVIDSDDTLLFGLVDRAAYRPLLIPRPAGTTIVLRRT